jgi:hypothetical protein
MRICLIALLLQTLILPCQASLPHDDDIDSQARNLLKNNLSAILKAFQHHNVPQSLEDALSLLSGRGITLSAKAQAFFGQEFIDQGKLQTDFLPFWEMISTQPVPQAESFFKELEDMTSMSDPFPSQPCLSYIQEGQPFIPSSLYQMTTLEHLTLAGTSYISIPNLAKLSTVKSLTLQNIQGFYGTGVFEGVTGLYLQSSPFDPNLFANPCVFPRLHNLTFSLSQGQGIAQAPLSSLTTLTGIYSIITPYSNFPLSFLKIPALKKLTINFGAFPEPIPLHQSAGTSLIHLDLSFNKTLTDITPFLSFLPALTHLMVQSCSIASVNMDISPCSTLKMLDLKDNPLDTSVVHPSFFSASPLFQVIISQSSLQTLQKVVPSDRLFHFLTQ